MCMPALPRPSLPPWSGGQPQCLTAESPSQAQEAAWKRWHVFHTLGEDIRSFKKKVYIKWHVVSVSQSHLSVSMPIPQQGMHVFFLQPRKASGLLTTSPPERDCPAVPEGHVGPEMSQLFLPPHMFTGKWEEATSHLRCFVSGVASHTPK